MQQSLRRIHRDMWIGHTDWTNSKKALGKPVGCFLLYPFISLYNLLLTFFEEEFYGFLSESFYIESSLKAELRLDLKKILKK